IFGINAITLGTPQVPFKNIDRKVTGWLKAEIKNTRTQANFTLFDIYCEIRIKDNSVAMNAAEPVRPVIRVQVLGNALDTLEFPTV
ncbi:hypothetical protein LW976_17585, partial [Erwinia amylovora]|uniref:hypothetical protein n=1 Tax=Erwinia amylovora TaxID=552 RepID=UPI0020BE9716